jgi:hypothetical protein
VPQSALKTNPGGGGLPACVGRRSTKGLKVHRALTTCIDLRVEVLAIESASDI